jgi:hypothetical protein
VPPVTHFSGINKLSIRYAISRRVTHQTRCFGFECLWGRDQNTEHSSTSNCQCSTHLDIAIGQALPVHIEELLRPTTVCNLPFPTTYIPKFIQVINVVGNNQTKCLLSGICVSRSVIFNRFGCFSFCCGLGRRHA